MAVAFVDLQPSTPPASTRRLVGELSGATLMVSGPAAGPPPLGCVSSPILAGEGLADEIAERVFARLNEAGSKRQPFRTAEMCAAMPASR